LCLFLHECQALVLTRRPLSGFDRWLLFPSYKRFERDVVTLVYFSLMSDVHFCTFVLVPVVRRASLQGGAWGQGELDTFLVKAGTLNA